METNIQGSDCKSKQTNIPSQIKELNLCTSHSAKTNSTYNKISQIRLNDLQKHKSYDCVSKIDPKQVLQQILTHCDHQPLKITPDQELSSTTFKQQQLQVQNDRKKIFELRVDKFIKQQNTTRDQIIQLSGGIKEGYIVGDKVITVTRDKCHEYLVTPSHQKLQGKKFNNLNNVLKVEKIEEETNIIILQKYKNDYKKQIHLNPVQKVDGIERVYHLRDGLRGLQQLREIGVKHHNDIKPNNIALKQDGTVIIADYDTITNPNVSLEGEKINNWPKNDVHNLYESITLDIEDPTIKFKEKSAQYDQMVKEFPCPKKQLVQNRDKLQATKDIIQKTADEEQKSIVQFQKIQTQQQKQKYYQKAQTQTYQKGIQKIQQQVILKDYRQQVNQQYKFSAASIAVNAARACYQTYKNIKQTQKNTKKVVKQVLKAGAKECAKGFVGIGGKYVQQKITQTKILQNVSNYKYRVGGLGKFGINAGVEVGKQLIDFVASGKDLNQKNLYESGMKIGLNTAQYGVTQGFIHGAKQLGLQVAETFANYSGNTVASTVGKNAVNNTIKQVSEQAAINLFGKTFNSTLKSNGIGAFIGFAVGIAFDCARGQQLGDAILKNAKQTAYSTIGTAFGAAVGSVVPVLGTAVGGFLGGLLGSLF